MSKLPAYTAERDYVLVSANFRRLGEVDSMDGAVADGALAVRWIENNIATLGGDPQRIFIFGFSLGAYIAAKLGADASVLNDAGVDRSSIGGIALVDTVMYDIPRAIARADELGFPDSATNLPLIFTSDPDVQLNASPVTTITAGELYPPFLIFYVRQKDGLVHDLTRDQSEVLRDALVAVESDASVIEGVGKTQSNVMQCIGEPGDPLTSALDALVL